MIKVYWAEYTEVSYGEKVTQKTGKGVSCLQLPGIGSQHVCTHSLLFSQDSSCTCISVKNKYQGIVNKKNYQSLHRARKSLYFYQIEWTDIMEHAKNLS